MNETKVTVCSKCGSANINYQSVAKVKNKRHHIWWWLYFITIGWIVELLMWFFLTFWMLLIRISHRQGVETKVEILAVCQSCGHSWKPTEGAKTKTRSGCLKAFLLAVAIFAVFSVIAVLAA
jgi:protein-arginine kinase activator protein McsA